MPRSKAAWRSSSAVSSTGRAGGAHLVERPGVEDGPFHRFLPKSSNFRYHFVKMRNRTDLTGTVPDPVSAELSDSPHPFVMSSRFHPRLRRIVMI
jgi:hypothetical protein